MWKVAVVLSAGTAILAGWSGARSEVPNAHDFSEYLIRLACQGRRAFAVTKPGSFVIVHLAAYSSVAQSRSRRWGVQTLRQIRRDACLHWCHLPYILLSLGVESDQLKSLTGSICVGNTEM